VQPQSNIPLEYATGNCPERSSIRWWICGLLFLATTINYVDRAVIGVLKPTLQHDLGWTDHHYGRVVTVFQGTYAIGYLFAGALMDRIGVRIGYALAVALWSVAAMTTGAARGLWSFSIARGALGLAEGGNFPAAVKTVAEWFPKKERAFATGLFNAGANIGAVLTPALIPWITLHYGWRAAFVITGGVGLLWLIGWLMIYRPPEQHPGVSPAELAHIRADPPDPKVRVPWIQLLRLRSVWGVVISSSLTGPIFWFYLFWVPGFLFERHGLDLKTMGPPLVTIYLIADVGSVMGGWLSSRLVKRGWNPIAARKVTMLICAACVVPVFFASRVSGLWSATLLIALAAAAHQAWVANIYTLVSDALPRYAVSSVVGLQGFGGSVASMVFTELVAWVLTRTHNYTLPFAWAPCAYAIALVVVHIMVRPLKEDHLQPAAPAMN